jgi:hypothetical protein
MKMTCARRFAEALGSWMHLEACCFRAGLFSESSLKSAIGAVASSLRANHAAARVHADYELHAIQRVPDAERKLNGGRKRSVDFALIYDDRREPPSDPEVLIEAKWAGSSYCSISNLITDFIRLSIMKRAHPGASCLFVLAGHSRDLDAVLRRRPFAPGGRGSINCVGGGSIRKFRFMPSDRGHRRYFGAAISAFHGANIDVPVAFDISASSPYPPLPAKFRAVAWEVKAVDQKNLNPGDWPKPRIKKAANILVEDAIV